MCAPLRPRRAPLPNKQHFLTKAKPGPKVLGFLFADLLTSEKHIQAMP